MISCIYENLTDCNYIEEIIVEVMTTSLYRNFQVYIGYNYVVLFPMVSEIRDLSFLRSSTSLSAFFVLYIQVFVSVVSPSICLFPLLHRIARTSCSVFLESQTF